MNLKEIIIEGKKEFGERFVDQDSFDGWKTTYLYTKDIEQYPHVDDIKSHQNSLLIKIFEAEVEKMKGMVDVVLANAEGPMDDETRALKMKAIVENGLLTTLIKEHEELIAWLREKN